MSAHAEVVGEKGYAQVIHIGHHVVKSDEAASLHGTDTGPSPFGLLLASLGACTSITLRMYAERKGWELGTVEVRVKLLGDPASIDGGGQHIDRVVSFSAPLSDEQRAKLLEISEKTPVTKFLKAGAKIETRLA
jgi:putative redox protein